MLTWDDAITLMQKGAGTTDEDTVLKLLANQGYKKVLAEFGRPDTEKTKTASTVAQQQAYTMPFDVLRIHTVKVTVSDVSYFPQEEQSQDYWNRLNATPQYSDIPTRFFINKNFGVGGQELLLWPIPSTSDNTISIIFESTDRDMTATETTGGTVAVVQNSATVTGTGTSFTQVHVGRYFKITGIAPGDGLWYRIRSVESATSLTLENVYEGTSQSGLSGGIYTIRQMFALPEEMQIIPLYYALWHFFAFKQNLQQELKYQKLYAEELQAAQDRYGKRTSRSTVGRGESYGGNPLEYPDYFPQTIT